MSYVSPTGFDGLEVVLVVDIRRSERRIRLPHRLKLLYLYLTPSILLDRIIRLVSGLNVGVGQNPPSLVSQAHDRLCLDLILYECWMIGKEYRVFHRLGQRLTLIGALDGVISFDVNALNCVWYLRNVAGPP